MTAHQLQRPNSNRLRITRAREGVVLRRGGDASGEASMASLDLASLFAEREAQDAPAHVVTIAVDADTDQQWVAAALDWLDDHGRQPVVRTRVQLIRSLVERVAIVGAVVELELAHPRADLQRALLGARAAPTATLLLQAQHLRSLGVSVVARLGPLLPGLHDASADVRGSRRAGGFASLLSHVRAADLEAVELVLGKLDGDRLTAISDHLEPIALIELGRGFGLSSGALLSFAQRAQEGEPLKPRALDPHLAQVLRLQLRRAAESSGLSVETTATIARRAARAERRQYQPVIQGDLFFGT